MPPGLLEPITASLGLAGLDLTALSLGWARAAPVIVIVPAFGLRALPGPVRAVIGLALAATIGPAVSADPSLATHGLVAGLVAAFAQGIPIAIAAAVPLWAATMAGGVVDCVRNANETVSMPAVEGRPTPLGVPMALIASAAFLSMGGPARVAAALCVPMAVPGNLALMRAALDIAAGVQIAVAIAAPVLAAAVVVELGGALVARAASPAQVHALLAPARSFAILAVAALLLDRMAGVAALAVHARP